MYKGHKEHESQTCGRLVSITVKNNDRNEANIGNYSEVSLSIEAELLCDFFRD